MPESLLQAQDLYKLFGRRKVLREVNFRSIQGLLSALSERTG